MSEPQKGDEISSDLRNISIVIALVALFFFLLIAVGLCFGVKRGVLKFPGQWYIVNLYGLLLDFSGALLLAVTETNWFKLKSEKRAARTEGASRGWTKLESKNSTSLSRGSFMFNAFAEIARNFELGVEDVSKVVRFEDGTERDESGEISYHIYQVTEDGDRTRMMGPEQLYRIVNIRLDRKQESIQDTAVSISSAILAVGFFLTLLSFFFRNFTM